MYAPWIFFGAKDSIGLVVDLCVVTLILNIDEKKKTTAKSMPLLGYHSHLQLKPRRFNFNYNRFCDYYILEHCSFFRGQGDSFSLHFICAHTASPSTHRNNLAYNSLQFIDEKMLGLFHFIEFNKL